MNSDVVIYQSADGLVKMEAIVDASNETIWATQKAMAELFGVNVSGISRHLFNVFSSGELDEKSNVQFLHLANSDKPVKTFSLDVIISVGYRVKSLQGTYFRQWANKILKEYLLHCSSVHQRLTLIEYRLNEHDKKIDFFVRTSLPPVEGVFYDGQIFDAYVFATDLIRSAKISIILIDNYIDESVLLMLSKRQEGVAAEIRTGRLTETLKQDLVRHNAQYPPINLTETHNIHDRFLIVDDDVYHIGASLKDLGKKLFAFSKMSVPKDILI